MMKVANSLPADIAAELGQVISLWPQVEHVLRNILANAAGTDIKVARVVFREPGAESFGNTLRDLLIAEDVVLEGNGLATVTKTLKDTKERRDILAHSLWGHDEDGRLGVQLTRGTWNLGQYKRNPPRIAKKAFPDFLPIDAAYLTETKTMILECIRQARELDASVAELRHSLRQKSLEQAAPTNLRDQVVGTPQLPRRSSSE